MVTDPREGGKPRPDVLAREAFGERLAEGWRSYQGMFADVPHGTPKQMAALLALAGWPPASVPADRPQQDMSLLEQVRAAVSPLGICAPGMAYCQSGQCTPEDCGCQKIVDVVRLADRPGQHPPSDPQRADLIRVWDEAYYGRLNDPLDAGESWDQHKFAAFERGLFAVAAFGRASSPSGRPPEAADETLYLMHIAMLTAMGTLYGTLREVFPDAGITAWRPVTPTELANFIGGAGNEKGGEGIAAKGRQGSEENDEATEKASAQIDGVRGSARPGGAECLPESKQSTRQQPAAAWDRFWSLWAKGKDGYSVRDVAEATNQVLAAEIQARLAVGVPSHIETVSAAEAWMRAALSGPATDTPRGASK